MLYNQFSEYLLKEGDKNDLFVHVFPLKSKNRFSIIVYVDYINIIGTLKDLPKAIDWLMKDLGSTKFCLENWIFK